MQLKIVSKGLRFRGLGQPSTLKLKVSSKLFIHHSGDGVLAGYTINVDGNIRQLAAEVMHRVLRGLPHMRNSMLKGLAGFISRQTDDFPEVCPPICLSFCTGNA